MMKPYEIIKLDNVSFDFLVIATSCQNPLGYIEDIANELELECGKILFDLTLINGTKTNRYVFCNLQKGEPHLNTCSIAKNIDDCIKTISCNYFTEHKDIVQKSTISNALKFLLQSGYS